ncbi:arabinose dehydrogenase [Kosmotoga olearia]|uniref:Alcohol dehydrogenase GroES domain protein n=1 Tax=Kosmotoga olearia (strain ATCC BAA-1733 / DSM 21960 / TBF 19.5.1) TaxID=521045 RepID=C5CGY3_KOSOT|nr:arabinose dehydrogenase [Kosmotoga olearia]ACR79648.1 Alcohol dehydrogenase GroES domain protein [Kosmotoga olearia TBF 19.5.1]MDK2953082.1 L-iditol 2-dehydrogenase [Kosmotoga sp.]
MKALFYLGPKKLELRDIEEPKNEDGVVIKVLETGICGTDIKTFLRGHHLFKPPTILGHECYGIVVEKPAFVEHLEVGDYVAVAPYGECGVCEKCRKGLPELCKNKTYLPSGCFAQYITVPANHSLRGLFKIEKPGKQVVLAEPLACVIGTVRKFGVPERVLIVGGGVMGTLFAIYLSVRGTSVRILEPFEWRASFLKDMGLDVMEPDALKEKGYDMVVIAATIDEPFQYMDLMQDGGSLLLFGGYPKDKRLTLNPFHLHYREIVVSGSFGYSLPDFAEALEELGIENELYSKLVTHSYSVSEYDKAFEKVMDKECMKISLRMWENDEKA